MMAWESINFTEASLASLRPRINEYWVKDSGGKLSAHGLALRIYPSGTKKFYLVTRIGKRTVKMPIGAVGQISHKQAREKARLEMSRIVMTGIDPLLQKKAHRADEITLSQAFEEFLKSRGIKASTQASYRKTLELHLSDWINRPIVRISRDDVLSRYAKHSKVSVSSANTTMRLLRAVFNHADGQFEDVHGVRIRIDNPVDQLSKNKVWIKEQPRTRRITQDQFADWFREVDQLDGLIGDYLKLVLFTGLRRREASSLNWSDINLSDGTLTVSDTKNGKPLTIPLSTPVLQLLQNRYDERDSSPWVFPSSGKSGHLEEPKKAVARIAEIANVTASPHDLRRTFISIAEAVELSPYVIKRLVNHSTSDVTETHYIAIEMERLRIGSERVARAILSFAFHEAQADVLQMNRDAANG